jgi:hypothetical protein
MLMDRILTPESGFVNAVGDQPPLTFAAGWAIILNHGTWNLVKASGPDKSGFVIEGDGSTDG